MCEFCEIARHRREAYVIWENEKTIAFLDIDPIHEGHVLIIPKEHADSIDKIPADILLDVMKTARRIVAALREIYHNPGYTIMQNGGVFCDCGHVHFHVFPRYKNDGFGYIYPEGSAAYSKSVAENLRRHLAGDM